MNLELRIANYVILKLPVLFRYICLKFFCHSPVHYDLMVKHDIICHPEDNSYVNSW